MKKVSEIEFYIKGLIESNQQFDINSSRFYFEPLFPKSSFLVTTYKDGQQVKTAISARAKQRVKKVIESYGLSVVGSHYEDFKFSFRGVK